MKHARADYDRIQDPAGKIPADEPVFLLRAQDELACKAVAYYASLCEQAQAPEVAAKARGHADLMAAWPKKKVPDLAPSPKPCAACAGSGRVLWAGEDASTICPECGGSTPKP